MIRVMEDNENSEIDDVNEFTNDRDLNYRDIEIINANAQLLNKEALETLEYQVDIWKD
jgi:archaellum component FlaC